MSKKHFIAFAQHIAECGQPEEIRLGMALMVIRIAESDNPRFSRARFLKACGLGA